MTERALVLGCLPVNANRSQVRFEPNLPHRHVSYLCVVYIAIPLVCSLLLPGGRLAVSVQVREGRTRRYQHRLVEKETETAEKLAIWNSHLAHFDRVSEPIDNRAMAPPFVGSINQTCSSPR